MSEHQSLPTISSPEEPSRTAREIDHLLFPWNRRHLLEFQRLN